ncbi:MAG: AAA family ATPase [Desulfobacteraceae bacterium]|nr:AAA family ATPase [Desulfobacteraceae bacterium]
MIKKIKLKFGRAEGLEAVSIDVMPITVFVGANNSGKSKFLVELKQFCSSGKINVNNVIIDYVELTPIPEESLQEIIDRERIEPNPGEILQNNHILLGKRGPRYKVTVEKFKEALKNPNVQSANTCQWYLSYKTIVLNGNNRINLVNQQNGGNLQKPPESSFQVLFSNDIKREKARRIIHEAFNQYLVTDPTDLGRLKLRLAARAPENHFEERGLHDEAVKYHSNAMPISEASDGVKAFTGIITELIAGDPSILLIDEPEAFLHPSLSFKLGKEVSEIMSKTDKRLFVSTHSPYFVMGCIQSGASVNIVRLTYKDKVPTARILPNEKILNLMRNPLLRSTGVLSGLFYDFVIVTESDTDRAFYQEINERLLTHSEGRGIPNCLFLNAQNKQTEKTIIKPLRELGIPVAGIVDIDVLKDGGKVWSSLLDSCSIPDIEKSSLEESRLRFHNKFKEFDKNMKRDGGINILNDSDQEGLQNLFSRLEKYGLFVVQKGELESWLKNLNAAGHGPQWLVDIFEKMGEDPNSQSFLKPADDDVWSFIDNISKWFSNPIRNGIPK